MKKVHFICARATTYNGKQYKPGQAWDGDLPAPPVGVNWSIRQDDESSGPQMGFVRWAEQPDRPRAQPLSLTPEEKAILEENPYADLEEPEAAEPPPAAPSPASPETTASEKKPVPTMSAHLSMTEEELRDPFGIKVREEAHKADLLVETEKKDSPVDPPEEKK